MLNKLKQFFLELNIDMSDEQLNLLISICKEDLITRFGECSEEKLYQLSLSSIKLQWCRWVKQYSNNPLNKTIDCDNIIIEESKRKKAILENN